MLSSIASFLPSALHLNNTTTQEYVQVGPPTISPDTEDEEEPGDNDVQRNGNASLSCVQGQQRQEELTAELNGQPQGAKGAAKSAFETFIFVRPPPSKSNHPLNLQVQLVPPHGKPPTGVATQDDATTPTSARSRSSSNGTGTSLVRTNSRRSEVYTVNDTPTTTPTSATTNTNASTSSFASTASFTSSTASSSSGRRTIIPLYNLQAHNVMTNVIVDAGTDAKIARFQKRGIEMMEVGVLEPIEVWGEKERGRDNRGKRRDSLRLSVDEMSNWSGVKPRNSFLQPSGCGTGSRPVSAASSKTSLHSSSHSNLRMASPAPVLATGANPFPDQQQQQLPILDSTTPTPIPVSPPQTQVQFMTQAPPQKRNLFNKFFNKRSSLVAVAPSSGLEPDPSFGTFSLHPAPVTTKVVMQDFGKRGGHTLAPPPPPLMLGSPPQSPSSQQTTPRQTQTPRPDFGNGEDDEEEDGFVSPTPTVAPKGHGRNSSLTFMNNPFKTTLIRTGKNRLSAVVGGGGGGVEKEKEEKGKREEGKERKEEKEKRTLNLMQKRDASPAKTSLKRVSRSQLSLAGGGSNVELNGGGPLMLTQSQAREELSHLKQQQLALRPPILGIQPTFVSPAVPPPNALGSVASPLVAALSPRMSDATQENLLVGQRALMYVWLMKKWLKRRPVADGEGGGMFGESGRFAGFNLKGNNAPELGYGGVEVRFEWKRSKVKSGKEGRKSRRGRASTIGVESDDELAVRERTREREERGSVSSNVKERLLDKRRNRMSTGSFSTTTASEEGGGGEGSIGGKVKPRREGTIDDGEDSDPEDSETPWVCTLKIRRMTKLATDIISPPASAFSDFPKSATQPQILKLKVGTLSPTPHHPKVVAMLKVPFPLPDVEVDRMGVVQRKGFPPQQEQELEEDEEGRTPYYGLTLTAEEIKDIVCSTGLWLVVREGFGGVGRVSRKGDGWRIRA